MNKINYPNPQKIRKNWLDLNGQWQVYFPENETDCSLFPENNLFTQTIEVPYSYTFKRSQVAKKDYQPVMWYAKELDLVIQQDKNYLLQFEAVDYICDIWVNDQFVYQHVGGNTPFEVNLTPFLSEKNTIKIKVTDYNLVNQGLGKQKWKKENFLCWYTRTMGIWQNVWLEETGRTYLTNVEMIPNIHTASIEIDAFINDPQAEAMIESKVYYQGELINTLITSFKEGRAKYTVDVSSNSAHFRLHYWSPQDPNLYDVEFRILQDGRVTDEISSYFGMRHIESHEGRIYLNDQEIYQKLILNQGYYFEGGLTGTVEEMTDDLMKIKEMGFNGHRIHQKVENHRMLYLCDTLGLLTWAEFPSTFEFSQQSVNNTMHEIPAFVQKHINHPSIICYVAMNESWGINEISHNVKEQNFVNALYYQIKALDHTRLVIGNDGWEQTITDIATVHDYNSNEKTLIESYATEEIATKRSPSLTSGRKTYVAGYAQQNIPYMISEYGGVAYEENSNGESWGYGDRLTDKEAVLGKIEALTKAVMKVDFACGFCYTQLTDVEQEVNGLLTADRKYKFAPEKIKEMLDSDRQYGFIFK